AVEGAGLGNEVGGGRGRDGHQAADALGERVQLGKVDAAAGAARRLALQHAADLADLVNVSLSNSANDGTAVGQQVDDADAAQGDEGLADGRVANAEALGQFLRDQALPGSQLAL